MAGHGAGRGLRAGAVPPARPAGAGLRPGPYPRGGGHPPRGDLRPQPPPAPGHPVPDSDQDARRAPPAGGAAAGARVHHDGRLLLRRRRGGDGRLVRGAAGGLRAPLRRPGAAGGGGAGGQRGHRGAGERGVRPPLPGRRGHHRALPAPRLRLRRQSGEGRAPARPGGDPGSARRGDSGDGGGQHPRGQDDRRPRGHAGDRPLTDAQGRLLPGRPRTGSGARRGARLRRDQGRPGGERDEAAPGAGHRRPAPGDGRRGGRRRAGGGVGLAGGGQRGAHRRRPLGA